MIAGGGERVTLRQVAQYADACNLIVFDRSGAHTATVEDVLHRLAALRRHCEALGRPYETVLRTHVTGWLILAEDQAWLQAKLERTFPGQANKDFSGAWSDYVVAGTPEQAVAYYQGLASAGIQYFIVATQDAADEETIRLLAKRVLPQVAGT
jgi:alkanesulfonate monooxygenase SsuD/methylene tetrahydromethanopterin reductase-like flavin-dependent oxidoreductase (luciferase family)